jgi:hypothetical protein
MRVLIVVFLTVGAGGVWSAKHKTGTLTKSGSFSLIIIGGQYVRSPG